MQLPEAIRTDAVGMQHHSELNQTTFVIHFRFLV